MTDYYIEETDDGDVSFVSADGREIPGEMVGLIFEVHRTSPEFYKHWVELAANFVSTNPASLEA